MYPTANLYYFIREFDFPKEEFIKIYNSNPLLYYNDDFNIDLLYNGTYEEADLYYREALENPAESYRKLHFVQIKDSIREKYEDKVRVVSIGNVSKEFCAGTHVSNISEIRLIKIVSETAIAAGTRRIESVSAESAIEYLFEKSKLVDTLSRELKTPANELTTRIQKLESDNSNLNAEISEIKTQMVRNKFSSFISKAKPIEGGKLFISKIEDVPAPMVKVGMDLLSNKLGECILILVSVKPDNSGLSIYVKVSDSFVKKGINAGKIVNEIAAATDGKGGGRPNFAQGGGKNPEKLDEILEKLEKDFQ